MRVGISNWAAALLLASPPCLAQGELLWTFTGTDPGDNRGVAVASAGDLDGDGIGDLLLGAPRHDGAGSEAGQVLLISGLDGQVLLTVLGDVPFERLGSSLAGLADLDGDGVGDWAAGAPGGGYVRIYSGSSGLVLRDLTGFAGEQFGASLAGVGDLDGDGIGDVAVGAPEAGNTLSAVGAVKVYSGADGSLLLEVFGDAAFARFGYALAAAGEVDGDGVPDILVGHSNGTNEARVISGADGALIHLFSGQANLDWFGTAVAGVGDVNGDGRGELLVGAPQAILGGGYVRLYSGADGTLLRTIASPESGSLFGWSVSAVGDVDGDGAADLGVGAPLADSGPLFNSGALRVFSGADGALLLEIFGPQEEELLGWAVGARAHAPWIVGSPELEPGGGARVLSSGQAPPPLRHCIAAPNSVGPGVLLFAQGQANLSADDFGLRAEGAPAGQFGVFFVGSSVAPQSFGNGFRCVGGGVLRFAPQAVDGAGMAQRAIGLAPPPAGAGIVPGARRSLQFWYRDPAGGGAGFNLSDALEFVFTL